MEEIHCVQQEADNADHFSVARCVQLKLIKGFHNTIE